MTRPRRRTAARWRSSEGASLLCASQVRHAREPATRGRALSESKESRANGPGPCSLRRCAQDYFKAYVANSRVRVRVTFRCTATGFVLRFAFGRDQIWFARDVTSRWESSRDEVTFTPQPARTDAPDLGPYGASTCCSHTRMPARAPGRRVERQHRPHRPDSSASHARARLLRLAILTTSRGSLPRAGREWRHHPNYAVRITSMRPTQGVSPPG